MGVKSLWKLLEPVGRRVDIRTLSFRVLAVDASIWITQFVKAMRSAQGEMLENAHILGTLRRILKLLFFRVRPVFVFDGGTPALKRRTVLKRQARRTVHQARHEQAVRRLVLHEMQKRAAAAQAAADADDRGAGPAASFSTVSAPLHEGDTHAAPAAAPSAAARSTHTHTTAHAPSSAPRSTPSRSRPSSPSTRARVSVCVSAPEDEELEAEQEPDTAPVLPARSQEVDLSVVLSLPPHMQKEYIEELRRQQRQESRTHLMPVAAEPGAFSRAQIHAFLGVATFNAKVDKLNAEAAAAAAHGRRIAADASREFLLVRSEDAQQLASDALDRGVAANDEYTVSLARIKASIRAERTANDEDGFESEAMPGQAADDAEDAEPAGFIRESPRIEDVVRAQTQTPARSSATVSFNIADEPVTELTDVQRMQLLLESHRGPFRGFARGRGRRGRGRRPGAGTARRLADGSKVAAEVLEFVHGGSTGGVLLKHYDAMRGLASRGDAGESAPRAFVSTAEVAMRELSGAALATADHFDLETFSINAGVTGRPSTVTDTVAVSAAVPIDVDDVVEDDAAVPSASSARGAAPGDVRDGHTNDAAAGVDDHHGRAVAGPTNEESDFYETAGGFLRSEDEVVVPTVSSKHPLADAISPWEVYGASREVTNSSDNTRNTGIAAPPLDDDEWQDVDMHETTSAVLSHVQPAVCITRTAQDLALGDHEWEDVDDVDGSAAGVDKSSKQRIDDTVTGTVASTSISDAALLYVATGDAGAIVDATEPVEQVVDNTHASEVDDVELLAELPGSSATSSSDALQQAYALAGQMRGWAKHAFARAVPGVAQAARAAERATATAAAASSNVKVSGAVDGATHLPPAHQAGELFELRTKAVPSIADVDKSSGVDGDAQLIELSDAESVEAEAVVLQEMQAAQRAPTFAPPSESTASVSTGTLPTIMSDEEAARVRSQARAEARHAEGMNDSMRDDIILLLQLCGLPYIVAPMEAEAQCAELERAGLVDGVITDDSDAFLFGAKHVYRHIFSEGKYAEAYFMQDVERELGVDREDLTRLALLLGSDYTDGVDGIGPVNAMEVLRAFPGDVGLATFRDWLSGEYDPDASACADDAERVARVRAQEAFAQMHKTGRRKWAVGENFPSTLVLSAYRNPAVTHFDAARHAFSFQDVDIDALIAFTTDRLGWSRARAESEIAPVVREMTSGKKQTTLETYMVSYYDNERAAAIRSTRLAAAVGGLTNSDAAQVVILPPSTSGKATGSSSKRRRGPSSTAQAILDELDDEADRADASAEEHDGIAHGSDDEFRPQRRRLRRKQR